MESRENAALGCAILAERRDESRGVERRIAQRWMTTRDFMMRSSMKRFGFTRHR
jgi:hypothetical protein